MNHPLENAAIADFPSPPEFENHEQEAWYLSHFIQFHGVLLIVDESELTILQISDNTELLLGMAPKSLLNKPIKKLLPLVEVEKLRDRLQQSRGDLCYRFQFIHQYQEISQSFHGLVRRQQQTVILEMEPMREDYQTIDHYERLTTFLARIKNETSLQGTAQVIVDEVQQLAGYDRVLLYRFEPDDSGIVIAEAQKNPTTSFLDLRFPAIDVPPIGLQSFYLNGIRLIADLDAPQVKMIPALNPVTGQLPNLRISTLLGISNCHIEYYHNMGVTASCVISIKDEDRFWGLIVGQNFSPKYLSPGIQNYFQALGQFVSFKLVKQEEQEFQVYRKEIEVIHARIQADLRNINHRKNYPHSPLPSGRLPIAKSHALAENLQNGDREIDSINAILEANGEGLLELVQAQGAALYFGNQLVLLGETPGLSDVQSLLKWFADYSQEKVFSTSCLSKLYPAAKDFQEEGSGLLAISIRLQKSAYYLLWFRPEVIKIVNWAGDPSPVETVDAIGQMRPSPRRFFEVWKESVRGTTVPWQSVELEAAKKLRDLLTLTALEFSQSALEAAAEQAEIANHAKSQFLAKMSHELRTPLNAILGFSQMMNRDESLSGEQRQYLKIINRSGEHLLSLINDVLEMSKIEAGRMSFNENHFDLLQVIEAIAEMLQLKASAKNLQLILECDANIPKYVITDEGKLRQVLINLLDNAIKFTQEGWIKLRVFPGTEPTQVFFEISDTGAGVPEEEFPLLFEPFVQTTTGRQLMQGAGLGLPICKQFINLLGGEVSVQSQVGQGSIFTFDVQLRLGDASANQQSLPTQQVIGLEPDQKTYRILVVEDVEENRSLLIQLLIPIGFEVRTVNNGREAIAAWQDWTPDLILMDMLMPVMDGYEATRRIRSKPGGKSTVIIALTANAFTDARIATLDAGCDDYLPKPYREQVLFEKISQHLGIRYCYRGENHALYHQKGATFSLTPESLQVMSQDWMKEVHQAARKMDEDQIGELIQQIPVGNEPLVESLTHLVDNFRLDLLLNLTKPHE
jgi:light-regulated signal transduction histidine kinase (bacteriophytochrome)/DNA-binding response OmpR family regulator